MTDGSEEEEKNLERNPEIEKVSGSHYGMYLKNFGQKPQSQ
jgi:hypothetical protein